jgi:hypothetical protein
VLQIIRSLCDNGNVTAEVLGPALRRLRKHRAEHLWLDGCVYFIAETKGRPRRIKIGWTSRDPRARLSQLQVSHPDRLELLGCLPGPRQREAELHAQFASAAVGGEWFYPVPGLLDEVDWLLDWPGTVSGDEGEFDAPRPACEWCLLVDEFDRDLEASLASGEPWWSTA